MLLDDVVQLPSGQLRFRQLVLQGDDVTCTAGPEGYGVRASNMAVEDHDFI